MRRVIRLGDRTSHGGYVVSATSRFIVMDQPVARLGDKCTCPKKGHNNCYIVEGDPDWTIDGVPVALEGHKLSCGAVLISSMPNAGREDWSGNETGVDHVAGANLASSTAAQNERHEFDQHFLVVDMSTGKPLLDFPYRLDLESGHSIEGRTNSDGKTEKISSHNAEEVVLHVYEEILPLNPNWDR